LISRSRNDHSVEDASDDRRTASSNKENSGEVDIPATQSQKPVQSLHIRNLSPVDIVTLSSQEISDPIPSPSSQKTNAGDKPSRSLRRSLFKLPQEPPSEDAIPICSTPLSHHRQDARSSIFGMQLLSPIQQKEKASLKEKGRKESESIGGIVRIAEPPTPIKISNIASLAAFEGTLRSQYDIESTPTRNSRPRRASQQTPTKHNSILATEPQSIVKACVVELEPMDVDHAIISQYRQKQVRRLSISNRTDTNSIQMIETPVQNRAQKEKSQIDVALAQKLRRCDDTNEHSDLTDDEEPISQSMSVVKGRVSYRKTTEMEEKRGSSANQQRSQKKQGEVGEPAIEENPSEESEDELPPTPAAKSLKKNQKTRQRTPSIELEASLSPAKKPTTERSRHSKQKQQSRHRSPISEKSPSRSPVRQMRSSRQRERTQSPKNSPAKSTRSKRGRKISSSDSSSSSPSPVKNRITKKRSQDRSLRSPSPELENPSQESEPENPSQESPEDAQSNRNVSATSKSKKSDDIFRRPHSPASLHSDLPESDTSVNRVVGTDFLRSVRSLAKRTLNNDTIETTVRDSMRLSMPTKKRKVYTTNSSTLSYFDITRNNGKKKRNNDNRKRTLYADDLNEFDEIRLAPSSQPTEVIATTQRSEDSNGMNQNERAMSVDYDVETEPEPVAVKKWGRPKKNTTVKVPESSRRNNTKETVPVPEAELMPPPESTAKPKKKKMPVRGKSPEPERDITPERDVTPEHDRSPSPPPRKTSKKPRTVVVHPDDPDEGFSSDHGGSAYNDIRYNPYDQGCQRPGLRIRRYGKPWWIPSACNSDNIGIVRVQHTSRKEIAAEESLMKKMKKTGIKANQFLNNNFEQWMKPTEKLRLFEEQKQEIKKSQNLRAKSREASRPPASVRSHSSVKTVKKTKKPAAVPLEDIREGSAESSSSMHSCVTTNSDNHSLSSIVQSICSEDLNGVQTEGPLVRCNQFDLAHLNNVK
jgi:hypothetical protein